MKNVFILFHVGGGGRLSQDTQLRLFAGNYYIKDADVAAVFFVGGGGLPVAGATQMKHFWIEKKFANVDLFACTRSNTSLSNISEIKNVIAQCNRIKSVIITNNYHCKRIKRKLLRDDVINVEVLGAEDILKNSDAWHDFVEAYDKSSYIKYMHVREFILRNLFFAEKVLGIIRRKFYALSKFKS